MVFTFKSKIVLGAALAFLYVPYTFATTGCNAVGWNNVHSDVTGCNLYYPAIAWLYEQGIAEGEKPAVTLEQINAGFDHGSENVRYYYPERPINRAEFTKLVLLASGTKNPPTCTSNPFPDVPKDAWFAPYVCAAKKRGIISGFPDGTFKPALNINYANASKILVKSFAVPTITADTFAIDNKELWYKPYVLALLRAEAVAPTIGSFTQLVNRGEMAEMLYRLVHKKPSYIMPTNETDNEPIGMGYGNSSPYTLEEELGFSVEAPDAPYIFVPSVTTLFGNVPTLQGYRFFHTLQEVRCGASGKWEHCAPTFEDWSIGMYVTDRSVAAAKQELLQYLEENEVLYFGGKPGNCSRWGVEGEYTQFCFVDLANNRTLIIERNFIDTDFAYWDIPGITPIKTSNAWFARIRMSMRFVDGM